MSGFTAPLNSYSKKNLKSKIALIDSDVFKYTVTHRMFKSLDSGIPYSKALLISKIDEILNQEVFERFEAGAYLFCFSAPSSKVFRNSYAQVKEYKGNRKNEVDKYYYDNKFEDMAEVYSYIQKRYMTLIFDDLEADDLLAMLQDLDATFILSQDKDLKQVVGWHLDRETNSLTYTSEEDAIRMISFQMLTGDRAFICGR